MRISDWSSDVCSSDLEAMLIDILTKPKNALVRQFQTLFEIEGVNLDVTDEALHAIARQAIELKTGASGLRSRMEDVQIGRASCRDRVCQYGQLQVVEVSIKKKNNKNI